MGEIKGTNTYFPDLSNERELWNKVWNSNHYADKDLRKLKAKVKIDFLLSHIKPNPSWQIIELGCGGGYLCEELYERTGCKITGVDFSDIAINTAINRLKDYPIKFVLSDVRYTNIEPSSMDLVICSGIIEHVSDIESCLTEIQRILKPEGLLFLTGSNLFSFTYLERIIKQILGLWKYGYIKNWSHSSIKSLLLEKGFSICLEDRIVSIGNLKTLAVLDSSLSSIFDFWGRYIVILGRKTI